MSNSVRPQRQQPTRLPRPWDSPGKNPGVGCHFLLQHMKVKSESEVAQSCWTPSDPMDSSPPGSSVHGIFQARVLEWVPLPSPFSPYILLKRRSIYIQIHMYSDICFRFFSILGNYRTLSNSVKANHICVFFIVSFPHLFTALNISIVSFLRAK